MEKRSEFYQQNILAYTRRSESLQRRIHLLGTVRLALVVGAVACLWFFRAESSYLLTAVVGGFVIPFAALMVYHTRLFGRKVYADDLITLCRNELKGLDYDFSAFDGAAEKSTSDHPFGLDLDLFGDRSLFQSVNRTVTAMGCECLAGWFSTPMTDKAAILRRQEAIQELGDLSQLRQHFYVTGVQRETSAQGDDALRLAELSTTTNVFAGSLLWRLLVWVVPILWVMVGAAYAFSLVPAAVPGLLFALSFLIAYSRMNAISKIHNRVDKMERILSNYAELMKSIQGDAFQSDELKEICGSLTAHNVTASEAIRRLSHILGALNQRFSLMGVLLNIFTLRDTRKAMALERWKLTYSDRCLRWFDALGRFDALSSLAGFAFNHPDYVYPKLADRYFVMSGRALGHPLLRREVCVKNDISIEKSPSFLIVTGANMAGKSTYLRTVGVNYLLACMGVPVCAEELTVYPAQLVTSLRTADSLMSNESYFFAELKRLKMIIDRLEAGEELFIILDEILKGTNSVDKQKGSLALMKQLVARRACGIIATHDLMLGSLEQEFPDQIRNYRFEADIHDNELTFSYRLREGVAQNMNACFLMKKMGITV